MNSVWAAIFDVDGVLVDSYRAHFESWQALCSERDLEMTEQQFIETFGRTSREIITKLWGRQYRLLEEIQELDSRKETLYREILQRDFPAIDGAAELVLRLHEAGFRLGVGSSGPPQNVFLVLDSLHCRGRFRSIVTGTDVQRGKPDPEVFILGAERLGAPPARCVVIEDAPAGVVAAHAAGMKCIALVSTGRARKELADAELVVDSLRDVQAQQVIDLIDEV